MDELFNCTQSVEDCSKNADCEIRDVNNVQDTEYMVKNNRVKYLPVYVNVYRQWMCQLDLGFLIRILHTDVSTLAYGHIGPRTVRYWCRSVWTLRH